MSKPNYKKIMHESKQITIKEWKEYYIRTTKGRAMQRRNRAISDKLHEVHKPWDQRSTPNSVHHPRTILFDLT